MDSNIFSGKNTLILISCIGKNDTSKTHLLKTLYSFAKSLEEFIKQSSQPHAVQETFSIILANKLLWTFQPEGNGLSEIVTKGQAKLKVKLAYWISIPKMIFNYSPMK